MKTRFLINGLTGDGEPEPRPGAVKRCDESANLRLRTALFACGDALFLLLVSVSSTAVMHFFHKLEWGMAATMVCGMAMAMALQTILAKFASPLLGSIESIVPSMIIAMASPMAICGLSLAGIHLDWRQSVKVGAAAGVLFFVLMRAYGIGCKRSLRRSFPR